ncbi:MAG TPA: hypothetical protein VMD04_02505 [Candidatus Margulisiibacteriota bacterium]|nr:hypothetical protein [Candidatus Margulisiibacteriota bacterium]
MKKLNLLLLAIFVCTCVFSVVEYAYSDAQVTVTANIPSYSPEITVALKQLTSAGQDPSTGANATVMNFGTLTHNLTTGGEAGVWYSPTYFCAFVYSNSWGKQYEIRSSCDGLTSTTSSLPPQSFMITPSYSSGDRWNATNNATAQGTMPGTLGTPGSAITGTGSYKVIYTSEAAASNRILRAFYSIPTYNSTGATPYSGWQPIPLNQSSGSYSGTVYITVSAI